MRYRCSRCGSLRIGNRRWTWYGEVKVVKFCKDCKSMDLRPLFKPVKRKKKTFKY